MAKPAEIERVLLLAERAAQFGLWYSDPAQHGDLVWSEGIYRIFGLSEKDFDGKVETFFRMVHPDDVEAVRKASLDALAGKSRYDVTHRIVRPDGETRWVHQEAEVLFDADRKPLQMVGMTQDITERKLAESSLKESEERYRTLIETSPLGVAIHRDGKFIYVNRAFSDIVDRTFDDLIGKDIYPVVHAEFRSIVRARVEGEVAHGRRAPMIEEKFVRPDGATVDVEVVTAPILMDGRPAAVTFVHDITRRKERESEIRTSEERFNLVVRATNDVIYDRDIEAGTLWWNDRLTAMLGRAPTGTAKDVVWWESHLHPEDKKRVLASLDSAIKGASSSWAGEYRFLTPGGDQLDILDRGYITRGEGGKVKRVVGSMVDITSRKLAEASVRESEEKFRTLFEMADDAIFMAEMETGDIVDCNRKAEVLLQRARKEIIGMNQTELHPPGLEEKYRGYFREHAAGKSVPDQMYAYRKDGTEVPIKISFSKFELEGRAYVAGVFHDVTDEVRREEELKRRNAELEQFVKVTTGREIKMMELKRENEELRKKLGGKAA